MSADVPDPLTQLREHLDLVVNGDELLDEGDSVRLVREYRREASKPPAERSWIRERAIEIVGFAIEDRTDPRWQAAIEQAISEDEAATAADAAEFDRWASPLPISSADDATLDAAEAFTDGWNATGAIVEAADAVFGGSDPISQGRSEIDGEGDGDD